MIDALIQGFEVSLSLQSVLLCIAGAFIGTAIGVLPGLGPVATISMLLPVSFHLAPAAAVIFLAGIYLGAMYGGSITSILVNVPGETASIVTCFDGHQMAKQGRAGAALAIAAYGSFVGGIVATVGLILLAPLVPLMAKHYSPAENAALVLVGLLLVVQVGQGSRLKGMTMVGAGLLLATVGADPITSSQRWSFGVPALFDGIGIVPIAIGLFGISELLMLAGGARESVPRMEKAPRLRDLVPNKAEWRRSIPAIGRGSLLGFFLGLLPSGGMAMVSFVAYATERKFSGHGQEFGQGAIEGVAGPETANNAASQSAFAPMLTLGLPANGTMGVIMGALMIHGITPGPGIIEQQPALFWGVITSMFIANAILVILNVPMISLFVQLLRVPYSILAPLIIVLVLIGAYSVDNSITDVWIAVSFGIVGYVLRVYGYDPAPCVLAFVLGGIFERSLRQALIIGDGFSVFYERSGAFVILMFACALVMVPALRALWRASRRFSKAKPASVVR